ncbi:MAG: ATP F0F1 synthase subunit B [Pseudomonadota bacterium]
MSLISVAHAASDAAGHTPFYADTSFLVGAAVLAFIGLLVYLGVHKNMAKSLDERAAKIQGELDEARKLKEEAQSLLAQHQRRQREASKEAGEIIAHATEEAKAIGAEVKGEITTLVERRTRLAEDRIKAAEAAAVKDVRRTAVEVATAAAQKVIAQHLTAGAQADSIDKAIGELDRKLH